MRIGRTRWTAVAVVAGIATVMQGVAQAAGPVRGGRLTAAMSTEPASLDPIFGNAPSVDRKIFNLIYENLITLDAKGELQLQLAQSWAIAPDQRSITFSSATASPSMTAHRSMPRPSTSASSARSTRR